MNRLIELIVISLFVMFIMTGCYGRPITNLNQYEQEMFSDIDWNRGRSLSATASGFQLLLFIPININDRQERAYQILRGQAGGDYISDIKIEESWTYAFVGTIYTTTMKGTAYPRKGKTY